MSKANYDLPDDTLAQVVKFSKAKTKREAIITALDEYIKRNLALELISMYGKIPTTWTQKSLRKSRDR